MRIAYVCADPGIPLFGRKGCSTHVRETCHVLRALGHEVKLIGTNLDGEADAEERRHVIGVAPFTSRKWGFDVRQMLIDRRVARCLRELLRTWRPDAIYERYSLYGWAGTQIARRYGVPRVLEVNAFLTRELAGRLRHAWLARRVEAAIFRRAPRLIVVSEPLRREIKALGVPPERITKMPMAVNLERFRPQPNAELRAALGLSDRFVIGYAGTLAGWHGLGLLYPMATALLRADAPPFAFLIVGGDGVKLEQHRARARQAGLESVLRFIGSVPYDDVPRYLNAMDAAIVPDTTYWSSPAKMFEYQACGLPVLAPAYPAVVEAIDDGVEGLLYPPRDVEAMTRAALALMRDEARRRAMGLAARRRAEADHSWEHNARGILDLFEQLQRESNRHRT